MASPFGRKILVNFSKDVLVHIVTFTVCRRLPFFHKLLSELTYVVFYWSPQKPQRAPQDLTKGLKCVLICCPKKRLPPSPYFFVLHVTVMHIYTFRAGRANPPHEFKDALMTRHPENFVTASCNGCERVNTY